MMRHAGREMSKECAACSVVNRMRYFVVCGRISRDMGQGIAIWGLSRRKGLSFSAISGIQYPACGNRICIFLVRHVKSAVCGNGLAHCHWL